MDGASVVTPAPVYLMLNKPRGLVTTARDEQGRATVYDCLRDAGLSWLSPVGRLDKASEGLLLMTNDTAFAAALTDPARQVLFSGQTQLLTPGGVLPLAFEMEVETLADAIARGFETSHRLAEARARRPREGKRRFRPRPWKLRAIDAGNAHRIMPQLKQIQVARG